MKKWRVQKTYLLFISILSLFLLAGCGGGDSGHWDGPTDTTRPAVTFTVPLNNATGIATNTKITATFTEKMAPSTINETTFTLKQGVTVVNGTVTYAGVTAVFTPDIDLLPATPYTATVTTGAKDLEGNALASNYAWSFTTGATSDTTAPTVTLTVPADAATGVATNTKITATFSEPMDPLTITTLTFTLFGGPAVPGTVTYSGVTAVFTPAADLEDDSTYSATITTGAKDLAGNGLASNFEWNFTTGAAPDNIAPTITITNPDDGEIDVPINKTINATFSEAMNPVTMTTANFMVEETLSGDPVLGTVAYNILNNIATFDPQDDLLLDTDYTVTITSSVQDLAGNPLVVPAVLGLPTPNPWIFTTTAVVGPPVDLAIDLGSAASFGIASRAGLTSTGVTVINGNVALHPLAVCVDSTGNAGASQTCLVQTYSSPTGMTVNGSIYWAGDPFDSGATALAITTDLNVAWVEGKNKIDTFATGFLSGQLGGPGPAGKILLPGVYHEATLNFAADTVATFDALNDANAIFIIKVDSSFTDSGTLLLPTEIKLVNGAQARNIWFVVGLDATIGSGSTFNGNILAGNSVTVLDGSTLMGRVLGGAAGAGAIVLTGADDSTTTITVPQ